MRAYSVMLLTVFEKTITPIQGLTVFPILLF